MREVKIGDNESGQRLDRFLMKYLDKSSRNNIYKLIRKKVFRVNGIRAKGEIMLNKGDVVSIYLADETLESLITSNSERKKDKRAFINKVKLDIVHEDEDILIVNKPKGLLTHPDKNEYKNTLSSKVGIYLEEYSTRMFRPAPVHRLDKNTSGLVIFAKNYQALKKYSELMRERKIQKKYLCVVKGHITKSATLQGWIVKNENRNKSRFIQISDTEALEYEKSQNIISTTKKQNIKNKFDKAKKYSKTSYVPLALYKEGYTLLEVELHTGRSHQIRVMLSSIGHSIVGDVKYGGQYISEISGQLLHAYKLGVGNISYTKQSQEIDDFINKLHPLEWCE